MMANLSGTYTVPVTSSELEKQVALTPENVADGIASARRSALIEQLTSRTSENGGAVNA